MYPVLFVICLLFRVHLFVAAAKNCKPAEVSMNGQALKDHTFKTSVVNAPFDCQVLCENELTCQSYNYFIPGKICELNNRTKEARPNNYVTDEDRFYVRSWPNRGRWQLPQKNEVVSQLNDVKHLRPASGIRERNLNFEIFRICSKNLQTVSTKKKKKMHRKILVQKPCNKRFFFFLNFNYFY